MMRRNGPLLLVLFALAALLLVAHAGEPGARARDLHARALVFDAHCDTAMRILDDRVDLGERGEQGHIDIPRLREGGVDAQVFALWPPPSSWPDRAAHRTLEMADAVLTQIARHPDHLGLALTVADAERITREGRIAVFLGIEGGHAIEDSLALLRGFHRLGVRLMTLTWMNNTNWADGSGDEPEHHGLTDLGREVVREMNRLGMVIDVSHVSDETFYHVLETTSRPVVASHSCARAICDHHRNLSDEMLLALKRNGGVIGINYFTGFLDKPTIDRMEQIWDGDDPVLTALRERYKKDRSNPEYRRQRRARFKELMRDVPPVTLDTLIDHIDHVVKIAGVAHVGLGSDFDGISSLPVGLRHTGDLPRITEKLVARGYSDQDIEKILGGNLLRVFRAAIGK